jgi:macrolide transport system ATP-binding/permease protein
MGWMRRVRALWRRDRLSTELDEELQFHLAMREEMNARDGLPAQEARLDARRRFGNTTLLKERTREIDIISLLETILLDVRFAVRMLMKHPGFTALAVVGLAVGIGVNTAVFTAYKAVILQPLDAKDPRQLVSIYRTSLHDPSAAGFSYPDFEAYRDHNHVFSGLIATAADELALTDVQGSPATGATRGGGVASAFGFRFPSMVAGGAEFVRVEIVSENYFPVLGVNAIRGRVFQTGDVRDLDAHPAVLMSENYWQRRFRGDPKLLGRTLKLNSAWFTLIGITPHDFMGTDVNVPDLWLPIRLSDLVHHGSDFLHDREDIGCRLYGRLAPGVTIGGAQAEMNILADQIRSLHLPHSEGSKPVTISLFPGSPFGVAQDSDQRIIMWGFRLILLAVGLVLLIACANVAGLQLARSAARQREIGVRLSLGASRLRLIRQLLTESALLGLLAGAFALVITWWVLRILVVEISAALPIEWGSLALHVEPDVHVFIYVFAISLLAGVLFGLAPALESSRPSLSSALKEEGARFGFRLGYTRLRDLLVGIQVCVCLFLLVAAGLLIRGSMRLLAVSPGYEIKHLVDLDINFPEGIGYTPQKEEAELRELRESIERLPGVTSVTAGGAAGGLRIATVALDGTKRVSESPARTLYYNFVAPNYFQTLSIPIAVGQDFAPQLTLSPAKVILSESAANRLWPGKNPIGRKMMLDVTGQYHGKDELIPQSVPYEVVGIAKDTRPVLPWVDSSTAYLPLPLDRWNGQPFLVRTKTAPKKLMADIGQQVHSVDPNLVVYAETLEDLFTATPSFVLSRLSAIFATIVGMLGLALASVGIYGSVSYAVVRRTREVGIRMALGARGNDVLSLVLRESTRPVLFGLLAGLIAAAVFSRLLRALLFGLSTFDAVSFLGVSTFFLLIAIFAAYVPAKRATRVDPMVALRYE